MANRYWVGGAGTWDATAGSKWATTSGGTGGAAVPTSSDDVFFDAASGAVAVATSGTTTDNCNNLDFTGFTGTLTHASSTNINIYGNFTAGAGMTYTVGNSSSSHLQFQAPSGSKTITSNGKTLAALYFLGAAGSWSLTGNTNFSVLAHTNGTVDFAGYNVTASGNFTSSGVATRSLILGSGTLTITGGVGITISGSNYTFSGASAPIIMSATNPKISLTGTAGGFTFNTITAANIGTSLFIEGEPMTCTSLSATGTGSGSMLLFMNDVTVTGTLTIAGQNAANHILVSCADTATSITLSAATTTLSYADFRGIDAAGAGTWTGTDICDALGCTGITFRASVTRYWIGNGGAATSTAKWSATPGGAGGASVPNRCDDVVFDADSFSSGSQNVTGVLFCRNIDTTATDQTHSLTGTLQIFGNVAFHATNTSQTAINNGLLGIGCTFSGGLTLASLHVGDFGATAAASAGLLTEYTLTSDMLFTGSQGLYVDGFGIFRADVYDVVNTGSGSVVNISGGTLYMGSGTWQASCTGTNPFRITSGTVHAETSTLLFDVAGSTAKNFDCQVPCTFNIVTIATDNLTLTGANFIDVLNVNTAGMTNGFKLTSGTITNITGQINTNGAPGSLAKFYSSSASVAATVRKTSGEIAFNYADLRRMTATGGAQWWAGKNSTDSGNNIGWAFANPPLPDAKIRAAALQFFR